SSASAVPKTNSWASTNRSSWKGSPIVIDSSARRIARADSASRTCGKMVMSDAATCHCKEFRHSYLLFVIVGDARDEDYPSRNSFRPRSRNPAARQSGKVARQAAVCICGGRAGQAIDDDGCGICDACLDAPLQATGNP